jgi:hypothetical protein
VRSVRLASNSDSSLEFFSANVVLSGGRTNEACTLNSVGGWIWMADSPYRLWIAGLTTSYDVLHHRNLRSIVWAAYLKLAFVTTEKHPRRCHRKAILILTPGSYPPVGRSQSRAFPFPPSTFTDANTSFNVIWDLGTGTPAENTREICTTRHCVQTRAWNGVGTQQETMIYSYVRSALE